MGYQASQIARSLVTGRTKTLGIVITDVIDPFVAEVMKGAEQAGRQDVLPLGVIVQRGPTLDGLGKYLRQVIVEPEAEPADVAQALRDSGACVAIDAVRCIKVALERGIGGPLYTPSRYFMKSPPEKYTDDVARSKVEAFIAGSDHHGQPDVEPALVQTTI